MPLSLTKEIEDCRTHAAHCASQAKNAVSPNIRDDFFRLERNWLQLARSYEIAERIASAGANEGGQRLRPN
jgi:hypothetical protein